MQHYLDSNPHLKKAPAKGRLPGTAYGGAVVFSADEEKKQAIVKAFQVRYHRISRAHVVKLT
jgi:hypothetical protein